MRRIASACVMPLCKNGAQTGAGRPRGERSGGRGAGRGRFVQRAPARRDPSALDCREEAWFNAPSTKLYAREGPAGNEKVHVARPSCRFIGCLRWTPFFGPRRGFVKVDPGWG
jgi:hypothetical protein